MKPSTRDQLLVLLAQAQWRSLWAISNNYGLWDARYYTYLTLWRAIMSLTPRETR